MGNKLKLLLSPNRLFMLKVRACTLTNIYIYHLTHTFTANKILLKFINSAKRVIKVLILLFKKLDQSLKRYSIQTNKNQKFL
jgi:hypothetical protein